jgi:hypothetical protein
MAFLIRDKATDGKIRRGSGKFCAGKERKLEKNRFRWTKKKEEEEEERVSETGLPDFSWYNIPKRKQILISSDKMYKIDVKYLDQMVIKYTNISHCKSLQNLPNSGFRFKIIASGNPAVGTTKK